jgi:hypothetical protein
MDILPLNEEGYNAVGSLRVALGLSWLAIMQGINFFEPEVHRVT